MALSYTKSSYIDITVDDSCSKKCTLLFSIKKQPKIYNYNKQLGPFIQLVIKIITCWFSICYRSFFVTFPKRVEPFVCGRRSCVCFCETPCQSSNKYMLQKYWTCIWLLICLPLKHAQAIAVFQCCPFCNVRCLPKFNVITTGWCSFDFVILICVKCQNNL